MYINSLKLINFRNYSSTSVNFSKNKNFLYGENAQGKTNILEAIYLCALGKSHRLSKDLELILFGKESYYIEIDLIKNFRSCKIEIAYNNKKEKRIKIAGKEIKKISELVGKLVVVMFSPDELKIIKEGPFYRRRFIDMLICQLSSAYLYDLQQYYKIAAQRNNLLRQIKKDKKCEETLEIWNKEFAEIAARILVKRTDFINKMASKAEKIHYALTEKTEKLEISYKSMIKIGEEINLSDNIIMLLEKNRKIDIEKGYTHIGPHRDDIMIIINDKEAGKYCSQGQQRTAVLSLKLAEMEVMEEEINENPILLLDDVFSELDQRRKKFLIDYIKDKQVFITGTEKLKMDFVRKDMDYFEVFAGNIEQRN